MQLQMGILSRMSMKVLLITGVGRSTRTTQIGHSTQRRPEIIDNFKTYKAIVSDKIDKLAREGPDRHSTAFIP